jgi:hypothetical protein
MKWFILKVNIFIGRKLFLALIIISLAAMFVMKNKMSGETFAFLVSVILGFVAGAISLDKATQSKNGGANNE